MNDSIEDKLFEEIYKFKNDPFGYVNYVFPWGEKGTILENECVDDWQVDVLNIIKEKCIEDIEEALQIAVASGHGPGKTALVAWIIHWFISTREEPQIVVTANTKTQLTTKTWRELAKWNNLAINGHWFKWTATKFYAVDSPETWFASAIPWSEHHSEAFAGTHERNVLVIFDEASNIPDIIWEVATGAMTTPGAMWFVFGNPTRNVGRFVDCFGKLRERWITRRIDSRKARLTNKREIEKWIEDYGEDSDFVRVRVKGQQPRTATSQFISIELVNESIERNHSPETYIHSPISIGADIARFGDDQTVFVVRQGVKVIDIRKFRELDTMQSASHLALLEDEYRRINSNITVFIDVVGIGAGVYDRYIQIGRDAIPVDAGMTPINHRRFYNKRIEMWSDMKEWMRDGGQIPDDQELKDDLTSIEYGFSGRGEAQLQLEKKADMKNRGLPSPDHGDGLSLTFALPMRYDLDDGQDDYLNYSLPVSKARTGY